jgi:hypothetical protein
MQNYQSAPLIQSFRILIGLQSVAIEQLIATFIDFPNATAEENLSPVFTFFFPAYCNNQSKAEILLI